MYHSITFGEKNTWTDWNLIPTSRPVFNPPPVKTKFIEVPGAHGELDLTTLLTATPMYGNRTGTFQFVFEKYNIDWATTVSEIANYIHGQNMNAILEDDPLYYYNGRFWITEWPAGSYFSTISIDYSVSPFKRLISKPETGGL